MYARCYLFFKCLLGFGLCLITFNFRCFQFTNLLARLNQFPDVLTFCFTFIFYLPKSISFCRFLLPLLLQCLLTAFLLFSFAFISFSFVAHLISFSFQKKLYMNQIAFEAHDSSHSFYQKQRSTI
jgi:hypothetical protein